MKNNKAPGPDRISNEILKILADNIERLLTKLFNKSFWEEKVPYQWKTAEIIVIFKKGDRQEIANYRPISLMSNVGKLFTSIIKNRICIRLDENHGREQAGFRKDFSIVDQIFIINQLIENANEYNIKIHFMLIDFKKAFHSVSHNYLWKVLAKQEIPLKWIRIIKNT